METSQYKIIRVDLNNQDHAYAIAVCIKEYMRDPMGGMPEFSHDFDYNLISGLKKHPSGIYFIAMYGSRPAGCAICFENFSTFYTKPVINIHDLIVTPGFRKMGIGRALLNCVKTEAEKRNCSKVTLEVREDNIIAQNLYKSEGFDECRPPMKFWVNVLH
jgi:GNAT superfamily N-acetyltransferase